MGKVWVYPEREFRELGEVRFDVSWEAVRKGSEGKEEIDPDEDLVSLHKPFTDEEKAKAYAKKLVLENKTAYGCVTVMREIVDWFVREDGIAEWTNAGEPIYVDSLD